MYKVRIIYFGERDTEEVEFASWIQANEYLRELIKNPFSGGGASIKRIILVEIVEEKVICVEFKMQYKEGVITDEITTTEA